jgi:hypothetical protein
MSVDADAARLNDRDPNEYVINIIEMCSVWTPADFSEFRKYLEVCKQRRELHLVREGEAPT